MNIVFAERMAHLPQYLTEKLNRIRQDKRRAGQDLIDMSMGNPRDPTPTPIVEKLRQAAIDPRNHRYSSASGIDSLKREFARYYQASFDVQLDPQHEVICTIGSKEGFSHLCLALLGHGDFAAVPSPAYPIHAYSVVLAGAHPLPIAVEDDDRCLQDIARHCQSEQRPKVLFLNYPHNPTGRCVDIAFFEEIVQLARRYQLIVVHDFAYQHIAFDGRIAPSFLQARGAREVGVEFGTMSKVFSMAGWRVGYAVGHPQIIQGLQRIKGYYDYGNFQAVQIASIIALRQRESFIPQQVARYEERRAVVLDGLRQAGWPVAAPQGGMFIWVRIPRQIPQHDDSYALALNLIERAGVVVSPGVGFGTPGEGYLRLALVENTKRLRQAMRSWKAHFSVS